MGLCGKRKVRLTSVEFGTDAVAEEDGDAAATLLVQGNLEGLGDHVLARVVEAGEAENEALLGAGRVALAKSLDDSTGQLCEYKLLEERVIKGLTRS